MGGYPMCDRDTTAALRENTDVIVTARAGPIHALAPCRIVYTIDETYGFGHSYCFRIAT